LKAAAKLEKVPKIPVAVNKPKTEDDPEVIDLDDEMLRKFNLPTSFNTTKSKNFPLTKEIVANPGPQRVNSKISGPIRPNISSGVNDVVGPPRPTNGDDNFVGPPRPTTDNEEDSLIQYEDEESNAYNIPFSHEIQLQEHSRLVSAIDLDPAGGRVLTGSFDYQVKFWDFVGMDTAFRSFRTIEPAEGNQIKSIQFSASGDRFLVATGNCQAKIYDRDGSEIDECVRGDMYLTDMSNTKGHVSGIGNAMWNPNNKNQFLTSSLDGTVRIWDVKDMQQTHKNVIKAKSQSGRRVGVSYASFSTDGTLIGAGCQDGSLQLWNDKGPFSRPSMIFRQAHLDSMDITCITFSTDKKTFISRSMDDTMKFWDLRNNKTPLAEFKDLTNYGQTNCIFSPEDKLIITGTSVPKGETGLLVFYDKDTLTRVKQIGISQGTSVHTISWHPKINQLLVGTSAGKVHVFYDPRMSNKGALLSVIRKPRIKDPNDYEPPRPVLVPNSLPMFTETFTSKRKQLREMYNPAKSTGMTKSQLQAAAQPEERVTGHGSAGKLGSSMTQQLLKSFVPYSNKREEDPREALLKYAEEAEKNPVFFGAYKITQPNPIYNFDPEPEPGASVIPERDKKKQKQSDP